MFGSSSGSRVIGSGQGGALFAAWRSGTTGLLILAMRSNMRDIFPRSSGEQTPRGPGDYGGSRASTVEAAPVCGNDEGILNSCVGYRRSGTKCRHKATQSNNSPALLGAGHGLPKLLEEMVLAGGSS